MQNSNDETVWQYHVRSVHGESLTPEEMQQLQAWYDAQDKLEMEQLSVVEPITTFSEQINNTLGHIAATTQNIQRLTAENEVLRQEISELRRRLAQRHLLQPA